MRFKTRAIVRATTVAPPLLLRKGKLRMRNARVRSRYPPPNAKLASVYDLYTIHDQIIFFCYRHVVLVSVAIQSGVLL